jgi:hypothetical protein
MFWVIAFVAGVLGQAQTVHEQMNVTSNVNNVTGCSGEIGFDFTVRAPITVTSIGFLDMRTAGLGANQSATIYDRSAGTLIATATANAGERRGGSGFFVFKPIAGGRVLASGHYSLIANVDGPESCSSNGIVSPEPSVFTTAAIRNVGPRSQTLANTAVFDPTSLVRVTFQYTVVAQATPSPVLPFQSCEEAACANQSTGEFNIRGVRRFCDNDRLGGGWLRVFRVADTTCEAMNLSSSRNVKALGVDPVGCRPLTNATKANNCPTIQIQSPYAFSEVLGTDFSMYSTGYPDAFASADMIAIRTASDDFVWTFAFGHVSTVSEYGCPCNDTRALSDTDVAALLNRTGDSYYCDRTSSDFAWSRQFGGSQCSGRSQTPVTSFVRTVSSQSLLKLSVCRNEGDDNEDIKLAELVLFVREKAGFNRSQCSATTTTTTATTTAAATTAATATTMAAATTATTATTTVAATTTTTALMSPPSTTTASSSSSFSPSSTVQLSDAAPAPNDVPLIAGAAVGALVFLLCVVGLAFFFLKRRGNDENAPAAKPEPKKDGYDSLSAVQTGTYDIASLAVDLPKIKSDSERDYGTLPDTQKGEKQPGVADYRGGAAVVYESLPPKEKVAYTTLPEVTKNYATGRMDSD